MLLPHFLCFLILASYSQTPSSGSTTGVGGSGHDPRLKYSNGDGEQEELQNGTVSGETEMRKAAFLKHNCQDQLEVILNEAAVLSHAHQNRDVQVASPNEQKLSFKPTTVLSGSCRNHVAWKFSFLPFPLNVLNHSPPETEAQENPMPPPPEDPRQLLVAQWHGCSQIWLQLAHPFAAQALAFTADALSANCFLPGRDVSQTGDIWHMFSTEL